jgi:hypothetical protein
MVAFKRIFHPFTLLTLAYTGFLMYNIRLLESGEGASEEKIDRRSNKGSIT